MKSFNNIVTEGLSGKILQLVFRQRGGKTIVSHRPEKREHIASAAQAMVRSSFKAAVQYAKAAMTDAATRLAYLAKAEKGQTAFNVAVADFFHAPEIILIDTGQYTGSSGSRILAAVTDDFKVQSVTVRIKDAGGQLIETGNAVALADGLHWQYDATVLNGNSTGSIISITAKDMPGHSVTKEQAA